VASVASVVKQHFNQLLPLFSMLSMYSVPSLFRLLVNLKPERDHGCHTGNAYGTMFSGSNTNRA
jgi:hypothetical protein